VGSVATVLRAGSYFGELIIFMTHLLTLAVYLTRCQCVRGHLLGRIITPRAVRQPDASCLLMSWHCRTSSLRILYPSYISSLRSFAALFPLTKLQTIAFIACRTFSYLSRVHHSAAALLLTSVTVHTVHVDDAFLPRDACTAKPDIATVSCLSVCIVDAS